MLVDDAHVFPTSTANGNRPVQPASSDLHEDHALPPTAASPGSGTAPHAVLTAAANGTPRESAALRPSSMLSPACHQQLVESLKRDVPESVLQQLRALARQKEHTGISAWHTFRDIERAGVSAGAQPLASSAAKR